MRDRSVRARLGARDDCGSAVARRHRAADAVTGAEMRSMKTTGAAAMLVVCGSFARAQSPVPLSLDAMQFMQGKWVGEGTNEVGGQGSGYFTFESNLQGKAWLRRNHSEYPSTNGRPAAVHDDMMIVYADAGSIRAFYTDTENHTIPYR